jgi:purine-binding chemotaxis protein CheW
MNTIIVFRVGGEHVGIDITKVLEVTETQQPVAVPKSESFILGLINVRGEVIPVLSLRKRLGLAGNSEGSFMLIVEDNRRRADLSVDELFGTKKIDENKINKKSELLLTREDKNFFLGVYETGKVPILILNLTKVLSKEDT